MGDEEMKGEEEASEEELEDTVGGGLDAAVGAPAAGISSLDDLGDVGEK